jgi:hypothetical protein
MNISKCYKLKSCETDVPCWGKRIKKSIFHLLIYIFTYLKVVFSVIYIEKEKIV